MSDFKIETIDLQNLKEQCLNIVLDLKKNDKYNKLFFKERVFVNLTVEQLEEITTDADLEEEKEFWQDTLNDLIELQTIINNSK